MKTITLTDEAFETIKDLVQAEIVTLENTKAFTEEEYENLGSMMADMKDVLAQLDKGA